MKELGNKLIANLHVFILLYAAWSIWGLYEEFSLEMTSLETRIPELDNEIQVTQKKVDEIQEFTKKADEYKVIVEEVARNIENVQKQLPADINDTQIMNYFNQEFELINLKNPQITPGKEEPSVYLISKDYTFKARGTYLQFLIFFERVGNATRIFNIKNMRLNSSSENDKGRFKLVDGEIVIQAYRFNPDFKVERGF